MGQTHETLGTLPNTELLEPVLIDPVHAIVIDSAGNEVATFDIVAPASEVITVFGAEHTAIDAARGEIGPVPVGVSGGLTEKLQQAGRLAKQDAASIPEAQLAEAPDDEFDVELAASGLAVDFPEAEETQGPGLFIDLLSDDEPDLLAASGESDAAAHHDRVAEVSTVVGEIILPEEAALEDFEDTDAAFEAELARERAEYAAALIMIATVKSENTLEPAGDEELTGTPGELDAAHDEPGEADPAQELDDAAEETHAERKLGGFIMAVVIETRGGDGAAAELFSNLDMLWLQFGEVAMRALSDLRPQEDQPAVEPAEEYDLAAV